jgi:phosphatidylglycerol:prolipoprotein diacylglycerol transferase
VIGRWGNYFNQELFGRPTNRPWGIPIEAVHRPLGHLNAPYFHPTFLYESLGNLAILGFLLWLGKRQRLPTGIIALAYFILYALLRIGMETLRIDQTPIIAGVRLPILFSGVMILTALSLLVYRFRHGSKTS